MIPQTDVSWQAASWQELLVGSITHTEQLLGLLNLDASQFPQGLDLKHAFPMRVPMPYIARMEKGNPNDPLLLQVLPQNQEALIAPGYTADPVGDAASNVLPGLIHKYRGRVLLTLSSQCAINCRYCFRRSFPYAENHLDKKALQRVLAYIVADDTISEVILSGGDPLSANDRLLAWLVDQLAAIEHVKRLRVHSRLPVVIPNRIGDAAIAWMTATRLQPVMVIHCNHANEIDQSVADASSKMREAGITLLNQSVLLRGVNDNADAQVALCERLFEVGVLPYYLHILDKVEGAAHFDMPLCEATELLKQMRSRLPGYLVPRLVREVAGDNSKQVVG